MSSSRRRFMQTAGAAAAGAAVAANDKAPTETAYVHREADHILELETTWSPLDRPDVVQRQKEWLAADFEALEPHVLRQSYVSSPSRDLPGWQRAYYGENLERLSQIKLRWDPNHLFRFPQSVPLPRPRQARG